MVARRRQGHLDLVTAPGPGMPPLVRVFDGRTSSLAVEFPVYEAFLGGVFVACGDVNGDGTPDIVTAADAGGGPHVRVFDGTTGAVMTQGMAYRVQDSRLGPIAPAARALRRPPSRSMTLTGSASTPALQLRA